MKTMEVGVEADEDEEGRRGSRAWIRSNHFHHQQQHPEHTRTPTTPYITTVHLEQKQPNRRIAYLLYYLFD